MLAFAATSSAFTAKRNSSGQPSPSEGSSLTRQRPLSTLMKENLTGLALEAEDYREWLRAQARLFVLIQERKAPEKEKQHLLKECAEDPAHHPFCIFLSDSKDWGPEKEPRRSRKHRNREELRRLAGVRKALLSGDLEALQKAAPADLRETIRALNSFNSLEKTYARLSTATECFPTALAFSMGSKAEELLPEKSYIEKAITLYGAAARCGDDDPAIQAKYRLSLLQVWNDQCAAAIPHLDSLAGGLGNNDYRSRALYWKAHCATKLSDASATKDAHEELLEEHPFSLHTILAQRQAVTQLGTSLSPDSPVQLRSKERPELNGILSAAEALLDIGEPVRARKVLDLISLAVEGTEPSFQLYLASLYSRGKDNIGKFRLLSPLFRDHSSFVSRASLELYYPRRIVNSSVIQSLGLDELLVLSLIRQESAFNERARSRAGARGLMQIMPATARRIERTPVSALYDPDRNVRIGSKYFSSLLRRYSGDTELALAAYNAGPNKVDQWLKRYPIENRMLFLDLLPFKETREYVASIARNYFWYTMLYGAAATAPGARPEPAAPVRTTATAAPSKEVFRIFKQL
ncbi:MAG: lytic transglycosylase domain-containing protein [Oligoflexia bacterium]|nr:lytic transglycosylase domain-containing protein [Oligoflexia bacterium]